MTTDTTLMMATYNRLDLTKRMIESLFSSDTGRDYNLVIIENNSQDGTRDYLDKMEYPSQLKKFILVKNEDNLGIAIARNQGLVEADKLGTKWYCTLDNDVEMPEGWLGECVNILSANKSYAGIGCNMEEKPYPLVTKNGFTFQDKPKGNLGTACMVFPKAIHNMLGFFNTEYGKYGLEDSDFGMRVRACGFKLGYIERMGTHFGVGDADKGEYRKYKTETHNKFLNLFNKNVHAYMSRKKPLFIKCNVGL
jgi:GT2 family glycosyltransferase